MEARIIIVALAVVLLLLRGSMFDRFNKKQGND